VGSTLVELNGVGAWAYVVELADSLRIRLALDDWLRMDLGTGQRVVVRLAGQDVRLFVTDVIEMPPVAWVTMVKRVRTGQWGRECNGGVTAEAGGVASKGSRGIIAPFRGFIFAKVP
jgi:hypothetical protein